MSLKQAVVVSAIAMFCGACVLQIVGDSRWWAGKCLSLFESDSWRPRFEIEVFDFLLIGGEQVPELLIGRVQDKDMERRVYGIAFLGMQDVGKAAPTLLAIALDPQEAPSARAAACVSLDELGANVPEGVLRELIAHGGGVGATAMSIASGANYDRLERSRWDAMSTVLWRMVTE